MDEPVSTIPNLGPAADRDFARAGITSAGQLRALGPDAAYLAYLRAGGTAHFIGYYAMVMGLQGRPWNDCKGAEKDALRARFDAIKAQVTLVPAGIEAILDEIGTSTRRGAQ
ncbi:TfoX/Sxy family DNA transformation protein [Pseudooceanicola sp. LIPI14-2-Ac024]|uniref:TfoX/Sxy family DNA transformation protein n=1 Tax=Pseudooceanicola sp. LIPI14-2-Ac024 TaxID=3344875 RepID=UPI0035D04789